jgi:hypothetical protein
VRAFISHISEEAKVAAGLKEALDRDFLGILDVFVSSDGESIAAGEEWLKSIDEALRGSKLLITLCSPISIRRPWINFEAGAAWMLNVPIIPLCHAGLTPRDLPMPLSLRQGLLLDEAEHLRRLYKRIADVLSCRMPVYSFKELAQVLSDLSMSIKSDAPDELRKLEDDREIGKRLHEAMNHPRFKWRTIDRLASAAGISEEVAANLLRANNEVRFSKGRTGNIIVGLRSRVGE